MSFQKAIQDYRFLRNRNYPEKAALKLVGDRYRLTALQRNCLFRGIIPQAACRLRKGKLISSSMVVDRPLGVDWYNILITVESYLKGYPVFVSDDGVLRDAAGVHGSYRPGKTTTRAVEAILKGISELAPGGLALYLDAPLSFSGQMAAELREQISSLLSTSFEVIVAPSADFYLKSFSGIVASSDSTIMDANNVEQVFDLSRYVLERHFGFKALPVTQTSL